MRRAHQRYVIPVFLLICLSILFFPLLLSISSHPGRPLKPSSVVERGISPLTPTSLHPECVGPHFPVFPQSLSSHPSPSSPRLSLSSVGDVSSYRRLLHPLIHSPVLFRITSTPYVTYETGLSSG